MWHEVYAPQTTTDCTWSRQKVTELTNIVHRYWGGSGEDGAVLMYGPSGCGKTCSIAPIVRSIAPNVLVRSHAMAPDVPAGKGVEDLQRFLWDASSGQATSSSSSSQLELQLAGRNVAVAPTVVSAADPRRPLCVRLVKLLCFGDSYLKQFGDSSSAAGGGGGGSGPTVASVMSRYLHNLAQPCTKPPPSSSSPVTITFFLHTTHDSHSDKVNLNQYFGESVVGQSNLIKFHCTGATVRSLKARLTTVLTCALRDTHSSRRIVLPAAELERIATCANGDVRQAMLQLQFMSIDPTSQTAKRTVPRNASSTIRSATPAAAVVDVDATTTDDDDEAERLFGSRPSTALAKAPPQPPTSRSKAIKNKLAVTRSAATQPSPTQTQCTIEDLLDTNDGLAEQRSALANKATTSHIKAAVGIRDDYIDVAHASARLLTQKYDVVDVLRVLTVPPERLLGYVTNNMYHYFEGHQVTEYADCCALASWLEPFTTPLEGAEHGGGIGVIGGDDQIGGSGGSHNHIRRVKLQAQEQEVLSRMGLHVFHCGYRTHHRHVCIPKVLLSQKPPPFMPPCFPRVSFDGRGGASRRRGEFRQRFPEKRSRLAMEYDDLAWCAPRDDGRAEEGGTTLRDVEALREEWADRIMAMCPTPLAVGSHHTPPASISCIVDALRGLFMAQDRKCCPTNEVVLDVMPMLMRIVMSPSGQTHQPPQSHPPSTTTTTTTTRWNFAAPSLQAPSPQGPLGRAAGSAVKKTMLNLQSLTPSPPPLPTPPPQPPLPRVRLTAKDVTILSSLSPLLTLAHRRRTMMATPTVHPDFVAHGSALSPAPEAIISGDASDPIEDD